MWIILQVHWLQVILPEVIYHSFAKMVCFKWYQYTGNMDRLEKGSFLLCINYWQVLQPPILRMVQLVDITLRRTLSFLYHHNYLQDKIPVSYLYPQTEYNYNPANVQASRNYQIPAVFSGILINLCNLKKSEI